MNLQKIIAVCSFIRTNDALENKLKIQYQEKPSFNPGIKQDEGKKQGMNTHSID